jgi:hypothetical protein
MSCRSRDYEDVLGGHIWESHAFCDEFNCRKIVTAISARQNQLPEPERSRIIELEATAARTKMDRS